jgi:cytidine deaminase
MNLNDKDRMLIEEARQIVKILKKNGNKFHSSVGCALLGTDGRVHTGVNMQSQVSSPISVDAEQVAITNGYMNGMKGIDTIVAVHLSPLGKYELLYPCGECREFIRMFGGDPWVIVSLKKKMKLSELLPY